ncbi:MAG: tetratricopeptide repeat protein [Cyanobacteria bacterium]|nr:tetratricopeptide repeat protein [Cyanobacteriota bacterium]
MSFADTLRQLEATDKLLEQARELARQGNLTEAEQICRQTLKTLVELYGPNSLKTSSCLVDLAEVNYQQRKYGDVIALLQQVLVVNKNEQFLTYEEVLTLQFKLARAIEKSGQYQVSCDKYRQLLDDAQTFYGMSSPFTRRVASNLTSLLTRQSCNIQNAETLLDDVTSRFGNQLQARTGNKNLRTAFSGRGSSEKRFTGSSCSTLTATGEFRRLRRRFGLRLSGIVASLLCVWFLVYGILDGNSDKDKKGHAAATAAINPATPGALAIYVGDYSSADRTIALTINTPEKGVISTADALNNPVTVEKLGTELYLKGKKGKRYIFRTSGQALVSDDGIKLYRTGSPELATVARMREVADQINNFYRANGRYPRYHTELNEIQSGHRSDTVLRCVGRNSPIMTCDDYSNMSALQASVLSLSFGTGTNEPGTVEVFVFPVSSSGDSAIVRGYDRDGHLLPCSVQGKCLSLTCVQGIVR